MPFTSFALPLFRPLRLDIVAVLGLIVTVHAIGVSADLDLMARAGLHAEQTARQPWRLVTYAVVHPGWVPAIGNSIAVVVGMTMCARATGPGVAWLGLSGGVFLPGLWLWFGLEGDQSMGGSSPAVYAALGMGAVAWNRMRHELTYHRRRDWLAGFGTLGLVALALAMPLLLQSPVRGGHAVGFTWGALLVGLSRRHRAKRTPSRETGFPAPGGRRDPASP